jgi:DNA-binding NarL/FixJ family response regulator
MRPIRVFVVDAREDFVAALTLFLKAHGGTEMVGSTNTGCQALECLPQIQPDAILVGVDAPRLSAGRLLPQLRALMPSTGIIVLDIYDCQTSRASALLLGADEYMDKGKIVAGLLPAIRRVTARKIRPDDRDDAAVRGEGVCRPPAVRPPDF